MSQPMGNKAFLVLGLAAALAAGPGARGQSLDSLQTVVVGGSGRAPVEVNLEALSGMSGGPGLSGDPDAVRLKAPRAKPRRIAAASPDREAAAPQPAPEPRPAPRLRLRPQPAAPAPDRPAAPKPQMMAAVDPAPAQPAPMVAPTPAPAPMVAPTPAPAPMVAPSPPPSIIPQTASPQPAEPPPARVAALPPAPSAPTPIPTPSTTEGTQVLRIEFGATSASLSAANENSLKGLAGQMAANDQRIQLKAFASGNPDNLSAARRLSLSRALAVRSYLIEQGIRSTRIDVRALGLASDGGPLDRVDVLLAGR